MAYGLVVPTISQTLLLQYMLNVTTADNPVLRLYQNDVTPSGTSVLGDFTPVATTNIVLTSTSWTFTTDSGTVISEYPSYTYTGLTAGTTIYGYYVTNNAGTSLLWAQRCFFAPINITVTAFTTQC